MKNIRQGTLLLVLFLGISGCSKWQQDPLAGQDSLIKAPQDAPKTPEKPSPPEPNDSVLVDTVESAFFTEGETGEFDIHARVLRPDYTSEVVVENIDEFPGATFDAATGKFMWQVPKGTIVNGQRIVKYLKIIAYGITPEGNKKFYHEKEVGITVDRLLDTPTIVSIQKNATMLREGTKLRISVLVKDVTAGTDSDTWPKLVIAPTEGQTNLAGFVKTLDTENEGKQQFLITLSVDLTDVEFTKSYDDTGFAVSVVSAFGKASAFENIHVPVVTSFRKLKSTWFETLTVSPTEKTTFNFMIFDPSEETRLSTPVFSGLPKQATITCDSGQLATSQNCTLVFTPDADLQLGARFNFSIKTSARNSDPRDKASVDHDMWFAIQVGDK